LRAFEKVVAGWISSGKRVFVVACQEQTSLSSSLYRFVPKGTLDFKTRSIEQTSERIPQGWTDLAFSNQIYEVQRIENPADPYFRNFSSDFHFGIQTECFHKPEIDENGETVRWSAGELVVELPRLAAGDAV